MPSPMPIAPPLRDLLPAPRAVVPRPGPGLALTGGVRALIEGVWSPRLDAALQRLLDRLGARPQGAPATLNIICGRSAEGVPRLGDDESYRLDIGAGTVSLQAAEEWGVLYGLNTLALLAEGGIEVPACRIDDGPRFPWRGLLLDVARHFIPLPALLRCVEGMALCRLNVLHLHLTDDQAFRFPSRAYPRLAAEPCYSLADLELLVRFAAERGIRVVPELDMPGHTASWLRAYPAWGAGTAEPSRRFGVHEACLDPSNHEVYEAVAVLIDELGEVFPDPWLHIGGDEVHPRWWSESQRVQSYAKKHALDGVDALHAHFNARVTKLAEERGKRVMGWDEVLHAALPATVAVQSWRGASARDRALAAGRDCVVSANYYLDLCFPADVHYRFDPEAPEAELLALEDDLLQDPRLRHVAAGMAWTHQWRERQGPDVEPAARPGRVLGAEACLWSELVDGDTLDVRLWTRLPALAERFWSPAACRDEADLYRRLPGFLESLRRLAGIDVHGQSRALLERAGLEPAWQPLAAVLEPVKWYGRLLGEEALAARLRGREMPLARPYDADTPLDRVVDGLFPESLEVRRLEALCAAAASGDETAARELLTVSALWAGLPETGAGPRELDPLAARLKALGIALGDVLEGRCEASTVLSSLDAAGAPVGEYLLAVVPCLQRWLPHLGGARAVSGSASGAVPGAVPGDAGDPG